MLQNAALCQDSDSYRVMQRITEANIRTLKLGRKRFSALESRELLAEGAVPVLVVPVGGEIWSRTTT